MQFLAEDCLVGLGRQSDVTCGVTHENSLCTCGQGIDYHCQRYGCAGAFQSAVDGLIVVKLVAQLLQILNLGGIVIDEVDLLCAVRLSPLCSDQADGAGAGDQNRVALLNAQLLDGVQTYGCRLTHCALFVGNAIGQLNQIETLNSDIFSIAAIAAGAVVVIVGAVRVALFLAVFATEAGKQREYGYSLAGQLVFSVENNFTGELVSGDSGEVICTVSKNTAYVTTADTAVFHFNKYFVVSNGGEGNLFIAKIAYSMKNRCMHGLCSFHSLIPHKL